MYEVVWASRLELFTQFYTIPDWFSCLELNTHQALHCLEGEIMHEQVNSWPCLEAAKNHPRAKSVNTVLMKNELNSCIGYLNPVPLISISTVDITSGFNNESSLIGCAPNFPAFD